MMTTINRTVSRFAIHQAFHWSALGVVMPVLTLTLRQLGLSLLEVGLAMGVYSLTTVVLEVPSGAIADLWGRRRTYFIGSVAQALSALVLLVCRGFPSVVGATILLGIARAFASGSLEAIVVEVIRRHDPKFDLQRLFSQIGAAIPAGLAVANFGGGFLPELHALPVLKSIVRLSPATNYSINLMVQIVLIVIAMLIANAFFSERPRTRETIPRPRDVLRQVGDSLGFAFRYRDLALVLSGALSIGVVLHAVETFWQPRLATIIVSETTRPFGYLGAAYFAVASIGSVLSPFFTRMTRGNRAVAIVVYRAASGLALLLLAAQTTARGFATFYLLFFFLYSITIPLQTAMLNEHTPDEKRSTLISTSSLILQLGGFVGSVTFGFVSQSFGIPASWTVAGVIFILGSAVYLPLIHSSHRVYRE